MKRMILAQMIRALKETLEVVGSIPTVHSLYFFCLKVKEDISNEDGNKDNYCFRENEHTVYTQCRVQQKGC